MIVSLIFVEIVNVIAAPAAGHSDQNMSRHRKVRL